MSDEEEVYSEEEEEEEVVEKKTTTTTTKAEEPAGDPEFIKRQDQKRSDLDDQLRDYISEWRKQRAKEAEELQRLKEKQAKRKVTRAEEERKMAERKKQEEERRLREIEEKKQKDQEEKRQRLEEAEKKRQAMLLAANASRTKSGKGPNFTVSKKDGDQVNLSPAQLERNKTKEQLEEEKKIALSIRIKPLNVDGLGVDKLREKAQELWECIVRLETEKYDLEERQKRQDYDLKELKERQKQQLRHKALKKGLDPEALTGKYPPKIQVASKYERRVDTRSYGDKKKLFEGGYTEIVKEANEKLWKEKYGQFDSRQKTKLPKWFGERPGKKAGDPETPEGEEEKQAVEEDEDIKEPTFEPEPEEEEIEEEVEEEEEEEDEEEEE